MSGIHDTGGSGSGQIVEKAERLRGDVDTCSLCGRVKEDWKRNRDSGSKARQRSDLEDRASTYRDWRRTLGRDLYVNDVDQVEWTMRNGVVIPVAVLELTRVDGDVQIPQTYLKAILDRFGRRDGQRQFIERIAGQLGVKAWVVLFRWSLLEYWIYNLSESRGWWYLDFERYERWLRRLRKGGTR